MRNALYASTSGIPDEGEGEAGLLARDTRSAITGGTLHAAAAFIQHMAAELRLRIGASAKILLTGGDAERVNGLLKDAIEVRPRLVLEGLFGAIGEMEFAPSG
jgi:pantothenate kinase type III